MSSEPASSRRRFLQGIAGGATAGAIGLTGCLRLPQQPGGPRSGPSGAAGPVGDRFYQSGPPERAGPTINATDYASLQDAHDALSPDSTLYIPASGGPYQERLEITQDAVTVLSDGGRIEQPDGGDYWTLSIGSDIDYPAEASLVGQHGPGDGAIHVTDTSPFSVGDDIHVTEWRRPWGEPRSGGAHGADTTSEFRHITDIDPGSETLTLHYPLNLPYPNESVTDVGVMSWSAMDVRVTGLRLNGLDDDSSRTLRIRGARDAWIDNVLIEYGAKNAATVGHSMRPRLNDIRINGGGQYGINVNHGTTHAYVTNVTSKNHNRYTVRFGLGGGDSRSSSDGRAENIEGNVDGRTIANCHWGGFSHTYTNVTATDSQVVSFRSRDLVLDGFEKTGGGDPDIVFAQRPANCTIRNGTIRNVASDKSKAFGFRLRDSSESVHGNEYFENLLIENIEIERFGSTPITDIGHFEGNQSGDGLTFRNITYGGETLTREHVTQWDGYDTVSISNLVVE